MQNNDPASAVVSTVGGEAAGLDLTPGVVFGQGGGKHPHGERPGMSKSESREAQEAKAALRERAEAAFVESTSPVPASPEEIRRVLHDLSVHRIELEMQNDELRRAQLALEISRSRWVDLYESAPVAYLTVGEAGSILESNLCAATLLGLSRDELVKQPFTKFISEGDQDTYYLLRRQLLLTDGRQSCELRVIGAGGALVWVGMTATAPRNADGSRDLRIVLTDLTTRKQSEANRQAQKVAEEASRAKSAFLANMSHELRTPLNAIIGFAHLLKRDGMSPEQGARLDKISAAGKHLVGVINSVLSLTRIEAGKLDPMVADVDLAQIVSEVRLMLSEQAAAKGLSLVTAPISLAAHLRGDPTLLQQALLNLVANAVKFTRTGSVTVSTRVESETADHALVRFEVEDTGIGIEPAVLSRLFTAFEQADNSLARQYDGAGLGLAITRRIARVMGGDAGATSTPGQGSTFWFTARLEKTAVQAVPASMRPSAATDAALLKQCAGARVLLAEDDPVNREVVAGLLADLDLDLAADGIEAVDLASRNHYDLLLVDIQMPRMDGLEAVKRIRQLPGYVDVPIIAMTASGFEEDHDRCTQAGMDAFVAKPVHWNRLFATMAELLSRHPRA